MPYTNFHGENQDWIIKTMKKLIDEWAAYGDNLQRLYDQFTAEINAEFDAYKEEINSDLANYGSLDVGDVFISVQYTLDNQDSLQTLDFYIAPLPTNQGDTGGKLYGLFFGISNGVMEIAFD